MKIKHRPYAPPPLPEGDATSDAYEREVQKSTAKLEKRYRAAQRALADAEKRHATASRAKVKPKPSELKRLSAEVERRRQELLELERIMTSFRGGGVHHRGTGQAKPWAQGGAL